MGFLKKVGLVFLILVVLAGIGLAYGYHALTTVSITGAQVYVKSGSVSVDGAPVVDRVKVKQGSTVATGADGIATVVLYESVLIDLAENTAVKIEDLAREHPKVEQLSGSTWNKFTKLFGVKGYSIRMGNSVASVRGTSFAFADGKLIVGEGVVELTVNGKTIAVEAGNVAESVNGEIVQRPATPEERALIKKRRRGTVDDLKKVRAQELERNAFVVDQAKKQFGVTDAQIEDALDNADSGNVDLDEVMQKYREKIPVEIGALTKIVDVTKQIQVENREDNETAAQG